MGNPIDDARAAGYSDNEINAYLAPRVADAMEAGYSQDEINAYLGIKAAPDFDFSRLRGHIQAELAARQAEPGAKPVTDLADALDAGLQTSVFGLIVRGKAPDKVLGAGAPWYSRLANSAAQLAGDSPAMGAGFLLGAPEGALAGGAAGSVAPGVGTAAGAAVGAAATGWAAANALPTVLRDTLMDAYDRGSFTNFRDFWNRASGILLDTAKSAITGAATGAAGKYVEGALPAAVSPAIRAATTTAAELGTMTTVGDALDGRVPSAQDFLDAGLLLGGLKASGMVAGRLRGLYAKTGVPPQAVVSDAAQDPTISQDLLSDNRDLPGAYTAPEGAALEARRRAAGSQPPGGGSQPGTQAPPFVATDNAPTIHHAARDDLLANEAMTGNEHMATVDTDGVRWDVANGPPNQVYPPKEVIPQLFDPSERLTLHHNHPNGTAPSDADVGALSAPGVARVVAHMGDHLFSVELTPEARQRATALGVQPGNQALRGLWQAARDAVLDVWPKDEGGVQVSRADWPQASDTTNRVLAAAGITDYTSTIPATQAVDIGGIADQIRALARRKGFNVAEATDSPALDRATAHVTVADGLAEIHRRHEGNGGPQPSAGGGDDSGGGGSSGQPPGGAGEPSEGPGRELAPHHGVPALIDDENLLTRPSEPSEGPGRASQDAELSPIRPSLEDAQKRVLAHINVGGEDPTRKMTWSRLYTNIVERFFPVWQTVRGAGGGDLGAADHAGKLASLYSGVWGKADHMLNYGTFDFGTYKNNGAGLKEILAPVKDDLDGFRAFAASARALELERRGVKTGFDMDAAKVVAAHGIDRYMPVLNGLMDYQGRVAAYLRDSGVLSQKGYEAMLEANKLYVPFYRVMGDPLRGPGTGGATLQPANPLKRIKGSEREIVDPLESIVRNTYLYTQMAERNAVVGALVKVLKAAEKDSPAGTELIPAAPREVAGDSDFVRYMHDLGVDAPDDLGPALRSAVEAEPKDQISMFRDGRRESYKVDIDLARAVKGLDNESMNTLVRVLAVPASLLRAGATLTPDFALRHALRDFMYAAITHPGRFTPLDMARGFAGLIGKDADYKAWLKSGGSQISLVSLDRQYLQENLEKLTQSTGLMDRAWNVVGTPSRWLPTMLHPLQMLTELAESASHLGAFKKAMREAENEAPMQNESAGGLPATTDGEPSGVGPGDYKRMLQEAGWSSRSTAVDVARRGAAMQAWNLISAFANVTLQDTDRVVRSFKDRPLSTTMRVAGGIVLPSALLWWANHDDPRYEEIPRWEKDLFWIVMTPNHIFRIPKPFGAGVLFGSGTERLMEAFAADNPAAFKRWGQSLIETLTPRMMPTAAAPMIDQFANRSTFTNQTLVPSYAEKLLPEYQYTPYTSETAKALGALLGAFPGIRDWKIDQDNPIAGGVARALSNPVLLENYISGWTGTLGRYALAVSDAGLRKAGLVPDPPKPAATLSDIPVIRAFTVRYPAGSAQSIQDFYDALDRGQVYFDTWMDRAKRGDTAAMRKVQEGGGPLMFIRLGQMKKVLGEQSQLIRNVWENPDIQPDEKRQIIDTTYYRMTEIAHAGNEVLRQMESAFSAR